MRRIASPVVDLPQPLSPTSPSVSPCRSVKLTPSTALTVAVWRRRQALGEGEVHREMLDAQNFGAGLTH